jgi:hypothetical protein
MSDAPETIWADWDKMHPELNGGTWWGEACKATEYRRADLAPTLSEAKQLPEVQALVAALEYIRDGGKINHLHMRRAASAALAQFTEAKP